ncbi:unnamed protein product [Rotaria sordida]|uniref:EF-hand domain-containing protein n=1 Tax=Rotaria sordida TaxID=392033 RepID=A0A818HH48_9BILA|nr:unnamed protein product [Rotaria sordida]
MSANNETIVKQAIGRHEFIGSLYDIRSDRFEGRNLFNQELPPSYISTADCAYTTYIVDENESQKDTFNKLNIDASMKVSLMAGLLNVEGSAKYLNQTKTDSRTVRVTHILHMKTKKQHLHISMTDLCNYFSSDALDNPNATHCVIGITWGANVAATFEENFATSQAAQEIQGNLSAYLKKPTMDISGDAELNYDDKTNSKFRSLNISFSGDIKIKDVPHTIEDVFNIFRTVPSEVEKLNDGKGQQLEFELYPLKRMAEIFKYKLSIERIIKDVSMHILYRLEDVFEQIIKGKRMINDFLDNVKPWKDWIPSNWIEIISIKQADLKIIQLDTQRQLATLLEQIRRGEVDEKKMIELLDNFDQNNRCSVRSIQQFLEENSQNNIKIDSLNEIRQCLEDGKEENKQSKGQDLNLLFPKTTSIHSFINQHYNNDVYLLHISNKWKENDVRNCPTGEMNEDEFIAEFQELFPRGNPRYYCNYAFRIFDKNNSGTITFDEYMSAISLTMPGDIEHQLALTFQMCAHHDQKQVSSEELFHLLQAVAELKGEDSSSASLIAKTIMKFDKRGKDEMITKEEFISGLKGNYDSCVAFLPIEVKKSTKPKESAKPLVSLGNEDLKLIHNFLTDYYNSISLLLTHTQNIENILKPKTEAFFTRLGCPTHADSQRRANNLTSKYLNIVTIWRTHYENVFLGLQPLLIDAVLNIRNTYNIDNN